MNGGAEGAGTERRLHALLTAPSREVPVSERLVQTVLSKPIQFEPRSDLGFQNISISYLYL